MFKVFVMAFLFISEQSNYAMEIECLTKMAYHEARGYNQKGVDDVVDVMFNRINSEKFPDTVCDNISMPRQYSWYNKHIPIKNEKVYNSIRLAVITRYTAFLVGKWEDRTNGSIFFRSDDKLPQPKVKLVFSRYGHKFYKL